MLFEVRCKQGKLQVTEEGNLQVISFGKPVWQTVCASVTEFITRDGMMNSVNIVVHAGGQEYHADMLTKQEFERLKAVFPNTPFTLAEKAPKPEKPKKPRFWYEDETKLTHMETYTKEKDAQSDLEAAYQHGWQLQDQQNQAGQISGAKIVAGAILAGPVGAMVGAIRSKGRVTFTFVRTPEWLVANGPNRV